MSQTPTPHPPHPKQATPEQGATPVGENAAQYLARASTIATLLAFVVMVFVGVNRSAEFGGRIVTFVSAGVTILLVLVGVITGSISLLLIPRYGRKGVLGQGLTGLLGSGLILSLIVLGFVIAMLSSSRSRDRDAQALSQIDRVADESMRKTREGIDSGDATKLVDAVEGMADTLDKASNSASPEGKKILAGQKRFLKSLQVKLDAYQKAVDEFTQTGGLDASSLESVDDLNTRLTKLAAWEKTNKDLTDFYSKYEQNAAGSMVEEGVPREKAAAIVRSGLSGIDLSIIGGIREQDRILIVSGRAMLQILRDNWGAWEVSDHETDESLRGVVTFAEGKDELAKRYNIEHNRVVDAATRQGELQQKMLSDMEAKQKEKTGATNPPAK